MTTPGIEYPRENIFSAIFVNLSLRILFLYDEYIDIATMRTDERLAMNTEFIIIFMKLSRKIYSYVSKNQIISCTIGMIKPNEDIIKHHNVDNIACLPYSLISIGVLFFWDE